MEMVIGQKERYSIRFDSIQFEMDLGRNLPEEIGMDILCRLPIGSLMNCKLVSRRWGDLVRRLPMRETLLAVFPTAALFHSEPLFPEPPYQILESDGGGPCRVVLNPPLPDYTPVNTSSAKGLILLQNPSNIFMVCNPITREYLRLPPLPHNHTIITEDEERRRSSRRRRTIRFGFGVSRMSEQYKVVRIVEEEKEGDGECHVYTLGTGEWRAIPFPAALRFQWENPECASVGGKLHWLASDGAEVCCFDTETEAFTAFSAPNPRCGLYWKLCALEDRLCVAEDTNSWTDSWTVIWLMTGAAEWSKQFVIATKCPGVNRLLFPIKVAEDGGGIWLGDEFQSFLLYYSHRTKTTKLSSDFHPSRPFRPYARVFTPSFLSLRSFREEDRVRSF